MFSRSGPGFSVKILEISQKAAYNHFYFEEHGIPASRITAYRYLLQEQGPDAKGLEAATLPVVAFTSIQKMNLHTLWLTFITGSQFEQAKLSIVVCKDLSYLFGSL